MQFSLDWRGRTGWTVKDSKDRILSFPTRQGLGHFNKDLSGKVQNSSQDWSEKALKSNSRKEKLSIFANKFIHRLSSPGMSKQQTRCVALIPFLRCRERALRLTVMGSTLKPLRGHIGICEVTQLFYSLPRAWKKKIHPPLFYDSLSRYKNGY